MEYFGNHTKNENRYQYQLHMLVCVMCIEAGCLENSPTRYNFSN